MLSINYLYGSDYYPFGMGMPGRVSLPVVYRFSFNSQEKEYNESSSSILLNFESRIFEPRIARFLSVDPHFRKYTDWSPYSFANCNPIRSIDKDGYGPGDGITRVYVAKITVVTKTEITTIYLAKRYYENISLAQWSKYQDEMQTPNGWYRVTQAEYELQQKNPSAFQYKVYGADTPEKYREIQGTIGTPFEGNLYTKGYHSGVIQVNSEGYDECGDQVSETFTFSVIDAGGNVLSSQSKTVNGSGIVEFEFNNNNNTTFRVTRSRNATSASVGVITRQVKGDRAPDTIEKFGLETPLSTDIEAVITD